MKFQKREKSWVFLFNEIRLFIGEDYKEPKAFGIYKDEESGNYIVYKNKANGERAIRYQGNEEEASQILWDRLEEEIKSEHSPTYVTE